MPIGTPTPVPPADDLSSLFGAPLPARPASALYTLGLGLVAFAMLLIPAIYVTLAAAVGYGVYYFATHYFWLCLRLPFPVAGQVLCAFTPLITGSAIFIFMAKPIFARRLEGMRPVRLLPQAEPRLFAMIEALCRTIGAPLPKRVEINGDLNASARLEHGLRGLWGNDLVLTIGMPLVAGLTAREFVGVLAHEFGHFSQRAGMRFSAVISRVNLWLVRAIYERDAWDDFLDGTLFSGHWILSLLALFARLGIWISHLVLRILLIVSHGISSFLLRQMEYDADACEIVVGGSASFQSTMEKLHTLGAAYAESTLMMESARMMDCTTRLPDDLPALVALIAESESDVRRERIVREAAEAKTGWLDTHPAFRDRIQHARDASEPGRPLPDEPAKSLFANFEALCKSVTLAHYRDGWELLVQDHDLLPAEDWLTRRRAAIAQSPLAAPPYAATSC